MTITSTFDMCSTRLAIDSGEMTLNTRQQHVLLRIEQQLDDHLQGLVSTRQALINIARVISIGA